MDNKTHCNKRQVVTQKLIQAAFIIILTILSWISPVYGDTKDTIVLIHGFMGWGRNEMFKVKYWGKPKRGVWQDMGTWSTWDHMDIIGHTWMWNLFDWRNPKDLSR